MQSSSSSLLISAVLLLAVATITLGQRNNAIWGNVQKNSTLSFADYIAKSSSVGSVTELRITYPPKGFINSRPIVGIRALDQKTNGNGAKATIVAGGINSTTVTVLFRSKRGHGINFNLAIYTPPCY